MPEKQNLIAVTGAGGFIGGSLVSALRKKATSIFGASTSSPSVIGQRFDDVENLQIEANPALSQNRL